MKRLLGYLSLICCLFFLTVGASRSADDKPPEKKEEPKAALTLDVPASLNVAVNGPATLTVNVAREGYKGPVQVKLTGLPNEEPKVADLAPEETTTTFAFTLHEKQTLELTVDVSGGELKADKKVSVKFPDPNPTDVKEPDPGKKAQLGANFIWTLVTGFLVMFMMAGFALVETGLTRSKNAAHTMSMNLLIYGIGIICYYCCGFALMYGGSGNNSTGTFGGLPFLNSEYSLKFVVPGYGEKEFGLCGYDGFFLFDRANDVSLLVLFLFQFVFMDTAATIPTGAMAERWKFSAFAVFGVFMCAFCYPIYGNWVWGGGWLSALGTNFQLGHGHVDFAGSSVVHMTGGVCALAGIMVLRARIGKYNKNGSVNVLPAHSVPMYVLGTMILAFGWFGFNPGSALQLGNDMVAARVAVNTMLASATGMVACTLYMWLFFGKPDPSFMCNGMLAGLVAITAPCAFVSTWAACAIGGVAGILVVWSALFFERIMKVDDPVGAVSVHGVNGAWGVLALGIFADGSYGQGSGWNNVHLYKETATGTLKWLDAVKEMPGWTEIGVTGWLYGNPSQFYAEAIGAGVNIVWVFITSLVFFGVYGLIIGNRVKREVELQGLDIHEMGVAGYIDDDPKTPEGHLTGAALREPRAAAAANGRGRFVVTVQGADDEMVTQAWSELCQPSQTPPSKDFLIVYPQMTTFQGTRFRFRGGDQKQISASLERLLQGRIGGKGVRTAIEP